MPRKPDLFDENVAALRVKLAGLGVSNISLSNACFHCGHQHPEFARACGNCSAEFWSEWTSEWYKSRLTRISLGQDHYARRIGNAFVVGATTALFVAAAASHHQASAAQALEGILFALLLGGLSIYEVWAYCHGKKTSIDNCIHTAKPANTFWRTFGLLLDFIALTMAFYVLISLR